MFVYFCSVEHFTWQIEYLVPLTALCTLAVGFLTYLVIYLSPKIQENLNAKYGHNYGRYYWVIITKLAGFILLGVIPALIIVCYLKKPLSEFGAGPITSSKTWPWMLICSAIVLVLNIAQGRRSKHYNIYPLIRFKKWNGKILAVSLITSTLFIIGYEFMFRGFLLYACLPLMGAWVAIAVNVIIYAFAHIHKGLTETIGSIPFGILLCYITLTTGNFGRSW